MSTIHEGLRRTSSQRSGRPATNSGTARIVKEYVKRVESHDLEEYPEWNLKVCMLRILPSAATSFLEQVLKRLCTQLVHFSLMGLPR